MIFHSLQSSFSQHISKNNYVGDWETPISWIPTWAVPQTTNINNNITIYGLLTRNGSLIFLDNSADMIVSDTLVIKGNLTIGHNDHLTVSDNGILIIRGNLILDDDASIDANGYLIVTGDIDKIGGTSHQYFKSNDNPVKVFIGGTIAAAFLNKTWFPVLECTTAPTIQYPNSTCSYGNMTDIKNDPIYTFFQSTCTIATPTITESGPTTFCSGGSVTLTSSPGTSYLWSTGATNRSINVTSSGSYTVRITNSSWCESPLSLPAVVTVNTLPVVTAGNNSPVCAGKFLNLSGGPAGMNNYSWTGPNGFASSLQNPTVSGSAAIETGGIYSLVVTNAAGCTRTATTTVVINALPVAFAGPDQELSIVSETKMQAELSVGETGEWSIINGFAKIINSHSPTTLVTELQSGVNKFQWKVNNEYCEASSLVKITIKELFVPSVITPDGDGKNDYFIISKNVGRVELIIFNKWGIEEYRNANYKNDWDGRNKKGTELPFDTYFYVMKFENGKAKKGTVLIKR